VPPLEVFLSHSHEDGPALTRLAELLRGHGVPVWYSEEAIRGSQRWHDEIGEALKRCDWFVVLLSSASVQSDWVKEELMYAMSQARYRSRIVPVILEDCDWPLLSWTLGNRQFIDLRTDFEAGCRELLRVWGVGLRPAAGP
jgi:TIR domain